MNEFCVSRTGGKVIPDVGNNVNSKSEEWEVQGACKNHQIVYSDWGRSRSTVERGAE